MVKGWYGNKMGHSLASRGLRSNGINIFRDLNPEEEKEFRAWVRLNEEEVAEAEISGRIEIFHPVVRDEWMSMKADASQEAIDFQYWASEQSLSYGELLEYQEHFKELGRKFNLTEEFEENGII